MSSAALSTFTLQDLTSGGTLQLVAGTQYWVEVLPGGVYSTLGWADNDGGVPMGQTESVDYNEGNNGWMLQNTVSVGFALVGTAMAPATSVPEPSSVALFALGLAALAAIVARRSSVAR